MGDTGHVRICLPGRSRAFQNIHSCPSRPFFCFVGKKPKQKVPSKAENIWKHLKTSDLTGASLWFRVKIKLKIIFHSGDLDQLRDVLCSDEDVAIPACEVSNPELQAPGIPAFEQLPQGIICCNLIPGLTSRSVPTIYQPPQVFHVFPVRFTILWDFSMNHHGRSPETSRWISSIKSTVTKSPLVTLRLLSGSFSANFGL